MASPSTNGQIPEARRRPHVLAVPLAGLVGHVNPLMHFCQQLATHGITVTFAYSQSSFERSQAAMTASPNAAAVDSGSQQSSSNDNMIRIVGVRDGLPYLTHLTADSTRLLCQSTIDVEDELVALARATQDPPITCIIADVYVVCASSVARRVGIPHVALWTQSAACFAAHVVATQNYASLQGPDALISCIPGCPSLKRKEMPTFLQALNPADYLFAVITKCFTEVENCPRILLNTFDELEHDIISFLNKRQNMCTIGPLLPREYLAAEGKMSQVCKSPLSSYSSPAADDAALTWLDMQKPRSVLFVAFGSFAVMSQAQIEELAAGLDASGCPFLMVVRDGFMEGESARFPTGFQEKMLMSGQALFVAWAFQLEVLAHPSIGGFLTHCGWNSTLEGICKGLPLLCLPFVVDQMMNSRCIVDAWGTGLDLNSESNPPTYVSLVSRFLIAKKIKCLMNPSLSPSIHERCKQLHVAASKAVLHDHGSSHLKLKSFVGWLQETA